MMDASGERGANERASKQPLEILISSESEATAKIPKGFISMLCAKLKAIRSEVDMFSRWSNSIYFPLENSIYSPVGRIRYDINPYIVNLSRFWRMPKAYRVRSTYRTSRTYIENPEGIYIDALRLIAKQCPAQEDIIIIKHGGLTGGDGTDGCFGFYS